MIEGVGEAGVRKAGKKWGGALFFWVRSCLPATHTGTPRALLFRSTIMSSACLLDLTSSFRADHPS